MELTLEAFIAAYASLGYEPCDDGRLEPGIEKVVIYTLSGKPTHAARQLSKGTWTSKLGKDVDIEHETPEDIFSFPKNLRQIYGLPRQYLKRPLRQE